MAMILHGRGLAASSGAWVAVLAFMVAPAVAEGPESPAANTGAKTAAKTGTDPAAATPGSPAPVTPPDAAKGATPPSPSKPGDRSAKPTDAEKRAAPADRNLAPPGSGGRSLAAEKAAIDGVSAKTSIDEILARALPQRSDRAGDWLAGAEPLHRCGEPRWIEPCIPLPPCHPSHPPHPYDLVGVAGDPTCGPIYRGPCCPRTGTHDDGPLPRLHRVNDRFFDAFYRTK